MLEWHPLCDETMRGDPFCDTTRKLSSRSMGAGSRGAAASPVNILALPGRLALSLRTVFWVFFFREHLLLGQERGLFVLENAYFWGKKAVQIRRRPFFWERLFLEQKRGPNSIKIPSITRSRFCPPPPSKNSSRATESVHSVLSQIKNELLHQLPLVQF